MRAFLCQEVDLGDYTDDVIEEITADTLPELLEAAAFYTSENTVGNPPRLYLVSEDLSKQFQEVFSRKLARDREEKAAKESKLKRDAVKARIDELEKRLTEIASGEQERWLRAELAKAQAIATQIGPGE